MRVWGSGWMGDGGMGGWMDGGMGGWGDGGMSEGEMTLKNQVIKSKSCWEGGGGRLWKDEWKIMER